MPTERAPLTQAQGPSYGSTGKDGSNDSDPEAPSPKYTPASISLGQESVEKAKRDERMLKYGVGAFSAFFLIYAIVILPLVLSFDQRWSFDSAFYFSVQAAAGIGFGGLDVLALTPVHDILTIFLLLFGSAFVSVLASFVYTYMIERQQAADLRDAQRAFRPTTAEFRKLFDAVDTNKDGTIDRDELHAALCKGGKQVAREDSDRLFALVDTNGDGGLSISEFRTAFLAAPTSSDATSSLRAELRHLEVLDGGPQPPWQAMLLASLLLVVVIIALVIYGSEGEHWSFLKSLLFAVSTLQTSGLLNPSIGPSDGGWPSLFIAFIIVIGVPLWACVINIAGSALSHEMRIRRRRVDVDARAREAVDVLLRRMHDTSLSVATQRAHNRKLATRESVDGIEHLLVTRSGFLELWLLRNGLVNEATLAAIDAEFDTLQQKGRADLAQVDLRLRFLQLVALNQLEPDQWEQVRRDEGMPNFVPMKPSAATSESDH